MRRNEKRTLHGSKISVYRQTFCLGLLLLLWPAVNSASHTKEARVKVPGAYGLVTQADVLVNDSL